jgi:hypothetical protein
MAPSAVASTIRNRPIACSTPLLRVWGVFLETLARFRPDLTLLAELAEIAGDDDFLPLGTAPLKLWPIISAPSSKVIEQPVTAKVEEPNGMLSNVASVRQEV